jgi:hypothetical protein
VIGASPGGVDLAVGIVGLYPITVFGCGLDALSASVSAERHPSAAPDVDLAEYTDSKHAYLDPTTKLALACACGAADDAGWGGGDEDIGLSLGTAFGCLTSLATHVRTVTTKGGRLASPFIFSHAYPNTPNSVVSIDLGLREYNSCFVCGSGAAGVAVGCATDQIELHRGKKILAGGADYPPPGCRTVPAGCVLALQDEESAGQEGREIAARILGWRCGMAEPASVLESALADAGMSSKDLNGTVGNARAGEPAVSFDDALGYTAGAAAVLDVACVCALSARGWRPFEPLGPMVGVLRSDSSGLTTVLLLEVLRSAEEAGD